MTTESHGFKRLVLGLQRSPPDRMLQLAVELAGLLQVELLGLFFEDTSVHDLAGMPFARELRPLNGGWHALDFDRLSRDIESAASNAERVLAGAAKSLSDRYRFEVVRGPLATTLTTVSRSGDIVMIPEPFNPAERATQQFAWLVEAAFRSAAAVMILPSRIVRTRGPIVVIAAAPGDPSLDAATTLARATKEQMIVVDVGDVPINDADINARGAAAGCPARHIVLGRSALSDPSVLERTVHQLQERLLVLTRGLIDEHKISTMASVHSVPVLVIEPVEMARQAAILRP
jgi:hypothetical protein